MTEAEERVFEKRASKHFRSQRELPNGRDFRWNSEKDPKSDKRFRHNFDTIFPNAPGVGI